MFSHDTGKQDTEVEDLVGIHLFLLSIPSLWDKHNSTLQEVLWFD